MVSKENMWSRFQIQKTVLLENHVSAKMTAIAIFKRTWNFEY